LISRGEVLGWLRTEGEGALAPLWERADRVRRERVGDAVHLRGLVEISNHCVRECAYCGLAAGRDGLARYRMSAEEVLDCARLAVRLGYGTLVLQAGEDYGLTAGWVEALVRRLREETPLAVTLSLGERKDEELRRWRCAGADRYLLRFETGNRDLYERIHPPLGARRSDRLAELGRLRELGYEVGSGILVGIPGQSWDDLADDLLRFRDLDLDMIGLGPYLPHPETPLGRVAAGEGGEGGGTSLPRPLPPGEQVPNDGTTTLKALALARLLCPEANIPSTTALATLDPARGRERGLGAGANVVMPNLTPAAYRAAYEIYPGKAGSGASAEACHADLLDRLAALGRIPGRGRGDSPVLLRRAEAGGISEELG
jgi:biotin synthase